MDNENMIATSIPNSLATLEKMLYWKCIGYCKES